MQLRTGNTMKVAFLRTSLPCFLNVCTQLKTKRSEVFVRYLCRVYMHISTYSFAQVYQPITLNTKRWCHFSSGTNQSVTTTANRRADNSHT